MSERHILATEMISLFKKWFDVFNTNLKFNHGLESYGLYLNSQNGILDEMSSFVQNIRAHNMKSGLREKKGILICNSSLKNLFLDSQKYHRIDYLLCPEYVANWFSNKYTQLVDSPKSPKNSNWIDFVSKGNLETSSDNFFQTVKIMEKHFKNLHGDRLSNDKYLRILQMH
ncbi:hypothetical protein AGLY_012132 [Aphis glycines]|uniref:Uncharacterized protein n=1 Tax=Aphis glycines TaxID=307491 RepID=A0A6G0T972_APHGL|nr:hypothetical protein AGLY_012132 [Aphis glycines]